MFNEWVLGYCAGSRKGMQSSKRAVTIISKTTASSRLKPYLAYHGVLDRSTLIEYFSTIYPFANWAKNPRLP